MGTGTGANYNPYIQVGEFGSKGTASCIVDYKTGRTVHLLSQAEVIAWHLLRWDDENLDIREQYPLPQEETLKIAREYGLNHPSTKSGPAVMTSDFLVTRKEGNFVVSVKSSLSNLNVSNLYIEQQYWLRKGAPWKLVTKEQMNITRYRNIKNIALHYNTDYFADEITFLKFLLARKYITTDMDSLIDFEDLLKERRNEIDIWKALQLGLATDAL